MIEYDLTIYIEDRDYITLSVKYEKEYELKMDVTNIGTNGVVHQNKYYPPHRIKEIEIKKK
jgi:hypothetical protein